jgi:bifunctional non-homologous end joining protein LigD
MALEVYRRKRNFERTAEPRGHARPEQRGDAGGGRFIIQKHDARRLHYDFRLEMDGALKSWAVTRGPSLVPGEKRLAVHVEDHPLDYADFEGTIPKGGYGGGTVIVWDRGRWKPIGDARKGYAKGTLDFSLAGEKLKGRWHLVRMRGKPREKREIWLLIKGDDEAARGARQPDILEERPESVKTGRVVEEVAGEEPGWSSKTGRIRRARKTDGAAAPLQRKPKNSRRAGLPDFIPLALATLATKAPAGKRWLHEIKFDGYRLQVRIDHGHVKLLTRGKLDWTAKFGKRLVAAFKALPVQTAVIDGELVVENDHGASDFSALQAALSEGRDKKFLFYAFDLLHLDGTDLRGKPLLDRKAKLERLLPADRASPLRYSAHFDEEGALVLRHACRLSLEGVVSKLRDGPYPSGRSKDWIKSKCSERQEFVVAGFLPSTTSSKAIGSLVLGYRESGKLVYAGRVGTGFSAAVARDLRKRLAPTARRTSPFPGKLTADQARQVRFVEPKLVAEVEFRGWTADRNLRHASFRGLREDKRAEDVVRERPVNVRESKPRSIGVKLTHPDRLYWPESGVTKEGLAQYYAEVWKRMAPFVVGRPLALLRCPEGIGEQCFFQKHAWKGLSPSIRLRRDPKDKSAEPIISIDDLDGLMGLVQGGVLEIHPWGSTLAALEKPDMITMDLDPGADVPWKDMIAAATEVRERLADAGLPTFLKTSGGKGLHVVAALTPKAGWTAVKDFTKSIATAMAGDSPDRFVASVSKSKRRGRILVDYLRNGRGATAVAAYSTRAREGAPVSMPLAWSELGPDIGSAYFTVSNAIPRLQNQDRDPWADFRRSAVPLPDRATKRR